MKLNLSRSLVSLLLCGGMLATLSAEESSEMDLMPYVERKITIPVDVGYTWYYLNIPVANALVTTYIDGVYGWGCGKTDWLAG